MKTMWFRNLTMALGLLGAANAFGQYPGGPSNVAPSSYPIQQSAAGLPSVLHSLPQVPSSYAPSSYAAPAVQQQAGMSYPQPGFAGYPQVPADPGFRLAGLQEQSPAAVYGAPGAAAVQPPASQNLVPQPVAPHVQPLQPYPQGQHYQPAQAYQAAPGCSTCGPTGMSYGYAQSVAPATTNCGSAPISQPCAADCGYAGPMAYQAPGILGGGHLGGHLAQHLGGAHHGRLAGLGTLPAGAKPWFFGGSYLNYRRVDDHKRPLALRDSDAADVLSTGDAQMNSMSGFEVLGGRYFNCGRNAIVASYWGIFSDTEMASITGMSAGEYRARHLVLNDVMMPVNAAGVVGPYDAYTWYDNAYVHRVQRSSEYHNVEVNLLGFSVGGASRNFNRPTAGTLFSGTRGGHSGCGYCGGAGCGACGGGSACAAEPKFATGPTGYIGPGCGSRLNLSWLAGFRYFRFEDNLQYATSFNNDGITRAIDDLYYDVNTTNNLYGFQIGGRGDYCVGKRVNVYGSGKVGVYGNHATLYSRLGTDTQVGYDVTYPTVNYLVDESDDQVAFLSELGTGIGIRLSPKWTATFGYQAIIASGVATSPGNVRSPRDFVRDQRYIDNLDTLILHGFNVGALYNF